MEAAMRKAVRPRQFSVAIAVEASGLPQDLPMQNGPAGTKNLAHVPLARLRPSSGEIAGLCAFVGCYLAVVGWFKWVDVYHAHFAADGALVVAYNFLRAVFAFYLFWIVSAPGTILIRALATGPK
jgi:hypothetical protein